jgi:hypothetical protein
MTMTATPPDQQPRQGLIDKDLTAKEFVHRAAWKAGVMGSLNVLVQVLAVRLTLLVSVGGAIYLTWLALAQPDPYRLACLGVYSLVVVVPLVWLSARR